MALGGVNGGNHGIMKLRGGAIRGDLSSTSSLLPLLPPTILLTVPLYLPLSAVPRRLFLLQSKQPGSCLFLILMSILDLGCHFLLLLLFCLSTFCEAWLTKVKLSGDYLLKMFACARSSIKE